MEKEIIQAYTIGDMTLGHMDKYHTELNDEEFKLLCILEGKIFTLEEFQSILNAENFEEYHCETTWVRFLTKD